MGVRRNRAAETPLVELKLHIELLDAVEEKRNIWRFVPPPGELNLYGISRATRMTHRDGVPILESVTRD